MLMVFLFIHHMCLRAMLSWGVCGIYSAVLLLTCGARWGTHPGFLFMYGRDKAHGSARQAVEARVKYLLLL